MEVNEVMCTSSSDLKDLFHHMMQPISIQTVTQMHIRFREFKVLNISWRLLCFLAFSDAFYVIFLKWVSHRNHRGNICGVDFIWLRNPNSARKALDVSWSEAVFGIIKVLIPVHYFFRYWPFLKLSKVLIVYSFLVLLFLSFSRSTCSLPLVCIW